MKRCPTCNRTYTDDTQSFCLTDGAPLLNDTGGQFDSQATLVSPGNPTSPQQSYSTSPPHGNQSQQSGWTQPTMPQYAQQQAKRSALPWVLGGLAVLLLGIIGLGAIAAVVMFSSGSNRNRRDIDVSTRNNSNRKTNSNSKSNDNSYSSSNNSNNSNEDTSSSSNYSDRVGRYTGDATNTTNDPPARGSADINIVSINSETNRVEMKLTFSNGLCGAGTSYGVIDKNGEMSLLGTLAASGGECANTSWLITTRCTFPDSDTLSCTYRLASSTLTPQIGKFEVTKQ